MDIKETYTSICTGWQPTLASLGCLTLRLCFVKDCLHLLEGCSLWLVLSLVFQGSLQSCTIIWYYCALCRCTRLAVRLESSRSTQRVCLSSVILPQQMHALYKIRCKLERDLSIIIRTIWLIDSHEHHIDLSRNAHQKMSRPSNGTHCLVAWWSFTCLFLRITSYAYAYLPDEAIHVADSSR